MRRDELGAAPHLHTDKAELVRVEGRSLHKRPPLGLFWGRLLVMFSQVGVTWEDRTDELSGWQESHLCSPCSAREWRARHCGNTPPECILQSATIS